mmetsp:Transcript_14256/g.45556  ORF Transcript_14256/g.45556 Transcript_14256/m.45556 type:complete len:395 (-) Transcript_14256:2081-3265(-)
MSRLAGEPLLLLVPPCEPSCAACVAASVEVGGLVAASGSRSARARTCSTLGGTPGGPLAAPAPAPAAALTPADAAAPSGEAAGARLDDEGPPPPPPPPLRGSILGDPVLPSTPPGAALDPASGCDAGRPRPCSRAAGSARAGMDARRTASHTCCSGVRRLSGAYVSCSRRICCSTVNVSPASPVAAHTPSGRSSRSLSVMCGDTVMICMSCTNSLHENPMLIAVSILSPVSTQTLIPALRRSRIVSGVPSCSLSSMAVAPSTCRLRSTSSAMRSRCCWRCDGWMLGSLRRRIQAAASPAVMERLANTKVRNPSCPNAFKCCVSVAAAGADCLARSKMTESAPLQNSTCEPSGRRISADMRLRVELNSFTASTSSVSSRPSRSTVTVREVRPTNL